MDRDDEVDTILRAGKLLQQFIVDGWTIIELKRLFFIRRNRKKMRAENYDNLGEYGNNEFTMSGRRVILPSTFQGGERFMSELYHDAMGICEMYGYPDLFITFTCNTKWPELTRFANNKGLRVEDRPDINCRVFKKILDELFDDLTKRHIFGKTNVG